MRRAIRTDPLSEDRKEETTYKTPSWWDDNIMDLKRVGTEAVCWI